MRATSSANARIAIVASPQLLCTLLLMPLLLGTYPADAVRTDIGDAIEAESSPPPLKSYGKGRKGLTQYLLAMWKIKYSGLDHIARRPTGLSLPVNKEIEDLVSNTATSLPQCMDNSPWTHIKTRLSQQAFIRHLLEIGDGQIIKKSLDDWWEPQKPSVSEWEKLNPAERAAWDKLDQTNLWNELVQWRTRQAVMGLARKAGHNRTVAREIAINVSGHPDFWEQSLISEEHIQMFFKEDLTLLPTFNFFVQKIGSSMFGAADKAQALTNEIQATLHDPSMIDQARMGFCGPSAVLHTLAITQPENFVPMAKSMFCDMTFKLGDTEVGKPHASILERLKISRNIENVDIETSQLEMRALDWMMTSALRSHASSIIDRFSSAYTWAGVRTTLLADWAGEAYPHSTEELVRLYDLQTRGENHSSIPKDMWTQKVLTKASADTTVVLMTMEVGTGAHMKKWLGSVNSFSRMHLGLKSTMWEKTMVEQGHAVVLVAAKSGTCYLFTWARYVHLPCDKLRLATDWAMGIDISTTSTVSDLGRQRLKELKRQLRRNVTTPLSNMMGPWWGGFYFFD